MVLAAAVLLTAGLFVGCKPGVIGGGANCGVRSGSTRQAIVYGRDDRREIFRLEGSRALFKPIAEQSIALLTQPHMLDFTTDDEYVRFSSSALYALKEGYEGSLWPDSAPPGAPRGPLCAGEAFRDQPILGHCSGTLIDHDLVLTAGHCAIGGCNSSTVFVFGVHYDENAQGPYDLKVPAENVYGCRKWVTNFNQTDDKGTPQETNGLLIDYAIAQLDRPVELPLKPAEVADVSTRPRSGEEVHVMGFPSGIPMKYGNGKVLSARSNEPDYFLVNTDTFKANSGSGLFNSEGKLVGEVAAGFADYAYDGTCGCARVANVPNDGGRLPGETVIRWEVAKNALCDARQWTSQLLCNRPAMVNDGECVYPETHTTSPEDCPDEVCGNAYCDPGERATCPEDCPEPVDNTPEGWKTSACGIATYDTGDGCHCECGAVDPDCAKEGQRVLRCRYANSTCEEGLCKDPETPAGVPPEWTRCGANRYNDGSTCDCDCGAPDPDCDGTKPTFGCSSGQVCSTAGICTQPSSPSNWSCVGAFGGNDGCDCDCGAPDPDCYGNGNNTAPNGCYYLSLECNTAGLCEDTQGRSPAGWNCNPHDYGDGLRCDCDTRCGIRDSDCDVDPPVLLGCDGPNCQSGGTCSVTKTAPAAGGDG